MAMRTDQWIMMNSNPEVERLKWLQHLKTDITEDRR